MQTIRLSKRGIAGLIEHRLQRRIILGYRSDCTIYGKTVRPDDVRRDREVVLQRGIVYIRGTAKAIVKIAIPEYGGDVVFAVQLAVTARQMTSIGEVVINLDVELTPGGFIQGICVKIVCPRFRAGVGRQRVHIYNFLSNG